MAVRDGNELSARSGGIPGGDGDCRSVVTTTGCRRRAGLFGRRSFDRSLGVRFYQQRGKYSALRRTRRGIAVVCYRSGTATDAPVDLAPLGVWIRLSASRRYLAIIGLGRDRFGYGTGQRHYRRQRLVAVIHCLRAATPGGKKSTHHPSRARLVRDSTVSRLGSDAIARDYPIAGRRTRRRASLGYFCGAENRGGTSATCPGWPLAVASVPAHGRGQCQPRSIHRRGAVGGSGHGAADARDRLSMALGSFLAGVLLADSEYRHELEADIEPFKGLLLGLFFIAVGMSIDLGLVARAPFIFLGLVLGLVAIKAAVLYAIARFSGQSRGSAVNLALYISQGGEFAFVLFALAANTGVMDKLLSDLLIVVVSASLAVTPLLVALNDRVFKIGSRPGKERAFDTMESSDHPVIIAGFGRVGQVVARILRTQKIPFTALEANFEQVDFVRKFGNKIYFGDASRLDLLRAAGAEKAKIFVLAIDDVEASLKTAQMVKTHYPHLKIYARSRNRMHSYQLLDLGVTVLMRETFLSSLELGRDVLVGLGITTAAADEIARRFRIHDEELLNKQRLLRHDEEQLIASSRQARDELERLFEQDRATINQEGTT